MCTPCARCASVFCAPRSRQIQKVLFLFYSVIFTVIAVFFTAAVCATLLHTTKHTSGMKVHNKTYHSETTGALLAWAVRTRMKMLSEVKNVAAHTPTWTQAKLDRHAAMIVCY
jgi:hypothetical protein